MAVCIFCRREGKPSREHVWPKWLRCYPAYQELRQQSGSTRPSWTGHTVGKDIAGRYETKAVERGRIPLLPDLTVKAVCVTCNTGWMSQLETKTQTILDPMINGAALRLSREEREVLGLWVAKTAFTYARSHLRADRPFADAEYAGMYEDRIPPARCVIWVGRSTAPEAYVGMAVEPLLLATTETDPDELATMPVTSANVYLAAHGVVFIVHFVPEPLVPEYRSLAFSGDQRIGLQQLWPIRGAVRWPLETIPPESLQAQRTYLSHVVESLALPIVGLTPGQVRRVKDDFMSGSDPAELRARRHVPPMGP